MPILSKSVTSEWKKLFVTCLTSVVRVYKKCSITVITIKFDNAIYIDNGNEDVYL